MKTIEPIFVVLGNLYPILTRYNVLTVRNRRIEEVERISMQFKDRVITYELSKVNVTNCDTIKKDEACRLKFVLDLDDEFYPNSDIVRIAINESIKEIEESKDKLLLEKDSLKIDKWPAYKENIRRIEIYISSSPKDFIKVVKKDILE